MNIRGVELYPVKRIEDLEDKTPVYIKFENEDVFTSQWGIVDQNKRVTIHKDFTISFNNRCKYYGLNKNEGNKAKKGIVVKF